METKPGIYTTEFWTNVILQILGVLQLSGVVDVNVNNKYVALGMAILGGLYSVGRGHAKEGVAYSVAEATNPITGKRKRRRRVASQSGQVLTIILVVLLLILIIPAIAVSKLFFVLVVILLLAALFSWPRGGAV